ncbi:hypothetical protein BCR42DRAFT_435598 [Absidia repens]|uniref:Uncharacterized protein n=1 Tax=Absidia repens TaxID=90262 RepID=A0A1X2IP03_9FUNG|nr:hypothetical protein BCR42DRAFT_435598 [Absidia repens]
MTYIKPAFRTIADVSCSPRWLTCSARRTMSAFSQMSDNDPEVLEREKNKQVNNKEKKDWQEKLATHSEAAIKADKNFEKSTKELQDESVDSLKNEK